MRNCRVRLPDATYKPASSSGTSAPPALATTCRPLPAARVDRGPAVSAARQTIGGIRNTYRRSFPRSCSTSSKAPSRNQRTSRRSPETRDGNRTSMAASPHSDATTEQPLASEEPVDDREPRRAIEQRARRPSTNAATRRRTGCRRSTRAQCGTTKTASGDQRAHAQHRERRNRAATRRPSRRRRCAPPGAPSHPARVQAKRDQEEGGRGLREEREQAEAAPRQSPSASRARPWRSTPTTPPGRRPSSPPAAPPASTSPT